MDSFIKHAALIWQQDGCTVDQARFKAWCEGPDGYARIEELISERDQWIAHAKNAIWSDSQQLRLAEAELAALVEAAEKVINSYWHSTDGVITGIYDLEAALAEIKSGVATTPYGLEGESHE